MAGQIKMLIDKIIRERSKGNETVALTTKTKIILKGINPNQWDENSPDDPAVIEKLKQVAKEFSIQI